MPEFKIPLIAVGTEFLCEECNEGFLRANNNVMQVSPTEEQFVNECINCGATKVFPTRYPRVDFQPAIPLEKAISDAREFHAQMEEENKN